MMHSMSQFKQFKFNTEQNVRDMIIMTDNWNAEVGFD